MRAPPTAAVRSGPVPPCPGRVLLVHPGALGDLLQALPAFAAVRAGWPQAHITLVTDWGLAPVVRPLGIVDAVVGYDAQVAYHGAAVRRAALFAGLVTRVRKLGPDAAGVFKGAAVYAALGAASSARVRVGLTRGRWGRLLTRPIQISAERHREDRYLDVVRGLGLDPNVRAPITWPTRSVPLPSGPGAPQRWLVVAPGGARNVKEAMPARRWPAERFGAVAAGLMAEDRELGVVVLGGAGDRLEAERVAGALPAERTRNLAGATDVFTARCVIAAATAYLGNDSGLMHLAGTTATPTVIVFGPTDPRVAAPRTAGMHALWAPARSTACVDDATGRARPCAAQCCISRVAEETVSAALRRALERSPTPSAEAAGCSVAPDRVEHGSGRAGSS